MISLWLADCCAIALSCPLPHRYRKFIFTVAIALAEYDRHHNESEWDFHKGKKPGSMETDSKKKSLLEMPGSLNVRFTAMFLLR
jgi:hypothetical protein